ncbi:MAG: class I SAM-dependent methyltransferase [Spirochaetaceae bacterium]|nr:class I SAM-dependent methyltransferase [Spirochaetaceae bacterium]
MAEFDKFAQNYSDEAAKDLGNFEKYRNTAFLYKSQYLKYILPKEPKGILDFGCGVGLNVPYLKKYFPNANLFGCDVSSESIKIAEDNFPYCEFSVVNTPEGLMRFRDKINVIFVSTVLHHIPSVEHEKWINGLHLAMNSGDYLVIFEHNIKNPITAKVVKGSKGDEEAIMLDARYCEQLVKGRFYGTLVRNQEIKVTCNNVRLRYTYFFPWRSSLFTAIERFLWFIPLGAQYCVYARKL